MSLSRTACALLMLLIAGTVTGVAAVAPAGKPAFQLLAQDPPAGATVATGDRVFLKIGYRSSTPVRFQAEALRQEIVQEEAFTNSAPPYDAGSGEALAWISFGGPVRIDAIRVVAYDLEWQQLADLTIPAVVTWEPPGNVAPREPAEWVGPLQKQHRQVFDTALDPLPKKPEPLFDIFLLISIISIPFYLLVQLRMLVRCQSGWRKYVIAPLLPLLPLSLYSLIGLGMESNYWIIFMTRYIPVALAYLGIVWLLIRYREKADAAANPL